MFSALSTPGRLCYKTSRGERGFEKELQELRRRLAVAASRYGSFVGDDILYDKETFRLCVRRAFERASKGEDPERIFPVKSDLLPEIADLRRQMIDLLRRPKISVEAATTDLTTTSQTQPISPVPMIPASQIAADLPRSVPHEICVIVEGVDQGITEGRPEQITDGDSGQKSRPVGSGGSVAGQSHASLPSSVAAI